MIYTIKKTIDLLCYPFYLLRGRKPWTLGYFTAKKNTIISSIDKHLFKDSNKIPEGYGLYMDERVIEYPWVFARLHDKLGLILDAGSALNHDFLLDKVPLSNGKLSICTLAPEKRCYAKKGISYIYDDLRNSMFRNNYFDTIVSISTIEHIGLDNTMLYTSDGTKKENNGDGYLAAVQDFKRILRPGGDCFITVPYGKPCVRGWFQVFDQKMVAKVMAEFSPSAFTIEYFGYTEEGWKKVCFEDIHDATFFDFHHDKKYDDDYAAGARGVVCMHLVG